MRYRSCSKTILGTVSRWPPRLKHPWKSTIRLLEYPPRLSILKSGNPDKLLAIKRVLDLQPWRSLQLSIASHQWTSAGKRLTENQRSLTLLSLGILLTVTTQQISILWTHSSTTSSSWWMSSTLFQGIFKSKRTLSKSISTWQKIQLLDKPWWAFSRWL